MGAVREAIANFWSENGLGGVIADGEGGRVSPRSTPRRPAPSWPTGGGAISRLPPADGAAALPRTGLPALGVDGDHGRPAASLVLALRAELVLLLPLLGLGAMVMVSGLFVVLWLNLRRPVREHGRRRQRGAADARTGIAEFDGSAAVNEPSRACASARPADRNSPASQAESPPKEAHIRLLLNSTAEGIYGVDTAGICTFCNPSCLRLLGYDAGGGAARQEHPRAGPPHPARRHALPRASSAASCSPTSTAGRPRRQRGLLAQGRQQRSRSSTGRTRSSTAASSPARSSPSSTSRSGAGARSSSGTSWRRSTRASWSSTATTGSRWPIARSACSSARRSSRSSAAPATRSSTDSRRPARTRGQPCPLREVFAAGAPQTGEHTHRRADGTEVRVDIRRYPRASTPPGRSPPRS